VTADVSVAWDTPSGKPRAVLVLGHGAGGDLNDPLLAAVAKGLVDHGVAVARFNFPYREAGRRAPGAQTQSEACYRDVASSQREPGIPLFCGGKSYGGRIASHIAAEGFEVDGLLFFSYPLHPPGKPERLRDAHLKLIRAPMLFVQGTRDPFARPDLLASTIEHLNTAQLVSIEGGDHSLRVRGRKSADVYAEVIAAAEGFLISR
jgi:predicted alpha/beta-hydrolase family hydrolase